MWPFGKSIEELVEADLLSFVGAQESQFLEFKEVMYPRKDPVARSEMLRDVSSIANSEGGILIVGMAEDGDARATGLVPVPEARVEGDRLVSASLAGIKDRIGLRTHLVPVVGGHVLVVHILKSYRKPHMVVADGANELWIRHDRQKSRMSIDEVRSFVLTAEDLEMKAERFIDDRRKDLGAVDGAFLSVTATPLSLQGGRVDVNGSPLKDMLRNTDVRSVGGIMLTGGFVGGPTLHGRVVETGSELSLEMFRTGHVEFLLRNRGLIVCSPEEAKAYFQREEVLHGQSVAEYIFRVLELSREVAERFTIADPYLITVSFWKIYGFFLASAHRAGGRGTPWAKSPELLLDPVVVGVEETTDDVLRRILAPIWNAFGHERCPYFDEEGKYRRPQ